MPFYPHQLLSVFRIIHIIYGITSPKDVKSHTHGIVWITLSSADRYGCYHIGIYPVLIVCSNHFRRDHLIKTYNTKT